MIQCLKRKAFQEKVRIRFCVGMEMGYVSTFFFVTMLMALLWLLSCLVGGARRLLTVAGYNPHRRPPTSDRKLHRWSKDWQETASVPGTL